MQISPVALTPNIAVLPPRDGWLLAFMTGRCHSATINTWRAQAEALTRSSSGRVHLLLFVDTPATIGKRGRDATTAFVDAMNGKVSAMVLVLKANGLWRAMFRAAVAAGTIRSRRDYPIAVVSTLQEAQKIFAQQNAQLPIESAESALEVMRQAVKSATEAALARGDKSAIVPGQQD